MFLFVDHGHGSWAWMNGAYSLRMIELYLQSGGLDVQSSEFEPGDSSPTYISFSMPEFVKWTSPQLT
ncbi:hypothetical protein GJ744_004977 [Endocarpon pusillum]|uniref:Uncharacterized protein n=1 Tax=Endocarpon pusillum TaxID=364733 RepID=A0A8H7E1C4_9EURO|nr:hypothetical protein GJ744_004977 [Endocarpon pusillum]